MTEPAPWPFPLRAPVVVTVTGNPRAKGRGRAMAVESKKEPGKFFARVFTPTATREWERDAKHVARLAMGEEHPFGGPLQLVVKIVFQVPVSWPRWKMDLLDKGWLLHTSKPDADNVLKAAKDALNSIVYLDDSQVVKSGVIKTYGPVPMVQITVRPLPAFPSTIKQNPRLQTAKAAE